ncbi:unnamed protein product [Adineta steineri]|uniref:Chorein N-terminal domain-containing protein n=1 Tax=Adineta steineri TaxID=433720 RepID=A0A814DL37_9BILA|nr:unnamed protein product [Adineta steineri]CAF0962062.1 unnamed protein product [Adineta steineri]
MVLKSIVRYIINNYLKDYIERLDDERLKLDLRHGNVSLENLHLKPEALVGFGIPVTVVVGFIEKLSIVIPWKNLRSNPTKVYLDGLYVLVVPKNEVPQDFREYHAEKMKRVQRKLDNLRKATLDEHKVEEKEKGFFERTKLQMMQNLHLTLKNFHISYETQSTTKLGHPFSFGITIHSLQLITTTNTQRIGKIKEHTYIIAKLEEINSLSIYWNTDCESRINKPFQYVVDDLKSKIATNDFVPKSNEMNYVFHPVNLKFVLEMIMKFAEHNFEKPTIKVDFTIERMNFEIDPKQLSDLLDFVKFQNYSVFYDRCREYRQLYLKEFLSNSTLTQEQEDRIHILESKLDVFTMAYIRHSIELENNQSSNGDTNTEYGWWNWWWSGKAKQTEDQRGRSIENVNTTEDFFSEESLNTDVQIKIHKLEFNLLSPPRKIKQNKKKEIISRIKIDNTQIDYKRRTISSSILLVLDLGYFQIYGLKSNENHRPLMLTSATKSLNSLIHIEFELAPTNKVSDYRFLLIMEPLTIIYDGATINEIVENFEPIDTKITFTNPIIKQRTREELEHDVFNQKIFDMTMQIKSLSLVSPEYGIYKQNSNIILIQFNNFLLKSCFSSDQQDDDTLFKTNLSERQYYVKYKLIFNDFRIVYLRPDKDRLNILESIKIFQMNFYKCIYSDENNLTDWRIYIRINEMGNIEFSKKTFKKLNSHYETIPLFSSTMLQTINRINLFFQIFSPYSTIEFYILIPKCSFIISRSQKLFETEFHSHILKTRNENEFNKFIQIVLKNVAMKVSSSSISNQLSQSFYQKNFIQLLYSDSHTKL